MPASALAAVLALGLSFNPASASQSTGEAPRLAELQGDHSPEAARERLRRFLARLAPDHADDFRWRRAGAGGEEIRLPGATERGLRAGKARWRSETGAFLVTPDLEALDLSLEFDWRKSRLDAASLAVSGEYLLIEGIRLANQGGLLEIERMHGPADAIGLLLAALLEGDLSRPSSGPVAIEGMALRAIDHERGNRRFSSVLSAARIVLDGLMAGEIEGERLLVASSVQIAEMSGEAEFDGRGRFSLDRLSWSLGEEGLDAAGAIEALVRDLGRPGAAVSMDLRLGGLEYQVWQVPVFMGEETDARVAAPEVSTRIDRTASGGIRLRQQADGVRYTVNLFMGTPFDEFYAALLGNGKGELETEMEYSLDMRLGEGRLEIADLFWSVDGLGSTRIGLDMDLDPDKFGGQLDEKILEAGVRKIAIEMHDEGVLRRLEDFVGEPLAGLVRKAGEDMLASGDLGNAALGYAIVEAASAVDHLVNDGAVLLSAEYGKAVPLGAALLSFLSSAGKPER